MQNLIKTLLNLFVITFALSASILSVRASDNQVAVYPYSERCVNQLDDPNGMYPEMIQGIQLLASNIAKHLENYGSITLKTCIYQMDHDDPYRVESQHEDDSVLYVVSNAYYEPDSMEVCEMVHDEIIDILWQAGHITVDSYENNYCQDGEVQYTVFMPMVLR